MPIIPIDLIERVEEGSCLLVAGPGVSFPPAGRLGPPGPAQLALELAHRLGGQLEGYSLPWVAQTYADRNGITSLREYVGGRLSEARYTPTLIHHLIAQLPFPMVIYMSQDNLLEEAYRLHKITHTFVQDSKELPYVKGKLVIQPYGNAQEEAGLRLTEDERRQVFAKNSELGDRMVTEAASHALLFTGFPINDAGFRELFFQLRPQKDEDLPRAYLAQPGADARDVYWQQRNASVLSIDACRLLLEMGEKLQQDGRLAGMKTGYEEPPPIDAEEQERRQKIKVEFGRFLGLGGEMESGDQFRPLSSGLHLMREASEETVMGSEARDETPGDRLDLSRGEYDAQLKLQQGNLEWAEGYLDRARDSFEESIGLNPNQSPAYLSLYYLLVETEALEEALDFYGKFVKHFPEQAFLPERYRIDKIFGQTDLGISYAVFDAERSQTVTVTIFRRLLPHQMEGLSGFLEEAGKIESGRISRVLEFDRYHTRTYIVTEYVEGQTLRERLNAGAGIPLDQGLQIAEQVALALEDGHRQGMPHLSLEPENIILGAKDVHLINYGFSRLTAAGRNTPRTSARPARVYESPEQRAGEAGDARSDVYALGTILYEMMTGHSPGLGAYQQVGEIHAQSGEAVDLFIAHARDLDPARRFRTVEEMRMEIQRISLASRQGWPAQYLRLALASISNAYTWLFAWPGILAFLLVVGLEVVVEIAQGSLPAALSGMVRFAWLGLVITPVCGALGYYIARDVARRQGLGSLIASGRGIGASLGFLLIVQFCRATNWERFSLGGMVTGLFARYFFLGFLYVVAMTLVGLGLILMAAGLVKGYKHRYTAGFYYGYLALTALVLIMALLKFPYGFVEP